MICFYVRSTTFHESILSVSSLRILRLC